MLHFLFSLNVMHLLVDGVGRNLTLPLFIHSSKCSLGESLSCLRGANFLAVAYKSTINNNGLNSSQHFIKINKNKNIKMIK